ncbi:MAG: PorV/PorQ family protein [Luteibaculum sp.]
MRFLISLVVILIGFNSFSQVLPNLGGQRAGVSTLSFLKNDIAPRSAAMGGASVALPGFAQSLFTNPAGIAEVKNMSFGVNQYWHGAGMNQTGVFAVLPRKNQVSSLGFFMEVRTEFQPQGTGQQVFATNTAFGLSYGLQLTEWFTLGVTGRFVYEQLAEYNNSTATVDLGFRYQTDWKDMAFAVMVQNFGGNSGLGGDYLAEGFNRNQAELDDYTTPTVFKLGLSMLALDREKQKIRVAFELNHPNDNAENFRFGAEYSFIDLLFVRAGFKVNVQGQRLPVGGLGLRSRIGAHPFYIDYTALPTDFYGLQHNISLVFELNKDSRE